MRKNKEKVWARRTLAGFILQQSITGTGKALNTLSSLELTGKIIEKARSLGASVAGVASVEALKASPSQRIYPKIGLLPEAHLHDAKDDTVSSEVVWPSDAVSALVIGVVHNSDEPELDWWDTKGTLGNRILIQINKELSAWIENTFSIKTYKLSYFVEKGGIFLKDAAVMAGLGCIGKNNLVITPEYGPRIRFRALFLGREAEATGPIEFNPCQDCEQPCRKACPIKAFQKTAYSAEGLSQSILPGIDGTYDRVICNMKMENDIKEAIMAKSKSKKELGYCIKYCRKCELVCPVEK